MSPTTRIRISKSAFECEDCANTIERVLLKQAGVESTAIDERGGELEVRFDRSQVDEERLTQLVEEWGYASSPTA